MIGLTLSVQLTIAYLEVLPAPVASELHCQVLREDLCAEWSKDPFTIVVSGWGAVQLTWTTMLLFVQLSQIARAMTTYESMKGQHAGTITTALATGSTTPEGGALNAAGSGPDPIAPGPGNRAAAPKRRAKEGCLTQWKKLLGLDTFIATALHGSKAPEVMARRKQNPFTRGFMRNCSDFWCDAETGAPGAKVLFGKKQDGSALLGGERVDYRKLYEVPTGMRYRSGGGGDYEAVRSEEV